MYRHPSRLFVSGGSEILSMGGDPLALPWYYLNIVSTIQQLRILIPDVQQVWLAVHQADDASASGKISSLHEWYEHLIVEGAKNGYYVNGAKRWLIVKPKKTLELQAKIVFDNTVNKHNS